MEGALGGGAAAQFGLMSAMRTGNPIVDMAVVMAIPVLFGMLANSKDQAWQVFYSLRKCCRRPSKEFYRRIEFEQRTTSWGSRVTGSEQRNNILQKVRAVARSYIRAVARVRFASSYM